MKDEIELGEILKQLYAISGILIDVYDLEGRSVARYPEKGAALLQPGQPERGGMQKVRAGQ